MATDYTLTILGDCRNVLCALRQYVPSQHLPLVNALIVNAALTLGDNGVSVMPELSSWTEEQAENSLWIAGLHFYEGTYENGGGPF